jgi:hypothetical protein
MRRTNERRGWAWALVFIGCSLAACGQKARTPQALAVTPGAEQIPLGLSQQLTATVTYTDGSAEDVTPRVTWSSSDPTVIQLSTTPGAEGSASALRAGSTVVTATFGALVEKTPFTVGPAVLQEVSVGPSNVTLALHTQVQFTATGLYTDGTKQDLTAQASWTCSNTAVATVSDTEASRGSTEAVAAGLAIINATYGSHTGSGALTVSPATLTSIQIATSAGSIPLGVGAQLNAVGVFSDQSNQPLTQQVTWTSSDPMIAAVSNDPATKGQVSAFSAGIVSITASLQGVQSAQQVEVTSATLTTLLVQPNGVSVIAGTSQQYKAIGLYSDGTKQDLTGQAVWLSDTPASATITATGLLQGLTPGMPKISVTMGAARASTFAYVVNASLTSIAVTPGSVSLPAGLSRRFQATGTYSNGVTRDVTGEATWTSSDTTVATVSNAVSSSGLATGAGVAGAATVSAAINGISGTASLTMTPATLTGILLTPAIPTLANGTQLEMEAVGQFSDNRQYDVTQFVTWLSSQPGIASVSNTDGSRGLLETLAVGISSITASWRGQVGGTTVTVSSAQLTSIDLTPKDGVIARGQLLALRAIGAFTDGSTQDVSPRVIWTSSDGSVANVSNDAASAGVVTGVAAGSATVFGTINGQRASTKVTVQP